MTGPEALRHLIEEIKMDRRTPEGADHNAVTIGRDLAYDLCKCTHKDIGDLAQRTLKDGPKALHEHRLFGYELHIDLELDGCVVKFWDLG